MQNEHDEKLEHELGINSNKTEKTFKQVCDECVEKVNAAWDKVLKDEKTKEDVVSLISNIINHNSAFKDFHGFVRLNISFGEVKSKEISQTFKKE